MNYNKNSGYGLGVLNSLHTNISGKVFVVGDSGTANRSMLQQIFDTDTDGKDRFFATIDAAINSTTANAGDKVYVMAGHAETISSATALNLDVAGVEIIGLGVGNDRPTITFDTAATTTIPVSAANITVKNIIFTANYADIVSVFTLTTANNFVIDNCYIKATATNMNFKYVVDTNTTTSDADGLTIVNSKWIEPDVNSLTMVKMDGDNYDVVIKNNFLQLGVKNNTAAIMAIINSKSVFNAQITNNRVFRLNTDTATGAILVTTDQADNSGIIARNFVQHADVAAELLITASSGFGTFENYASGVAGASGYLLPAADA